MELHAEITYSLPLALLLQILDMHAQTCQLRAHVPSGQLSVQGSLPTTCQAEVQVVQGKVRACLLRTGETGQVLLEGRNAFERLMRSGQLQWHVQPDVSSSFAASTKGALPAAVLPERHWAQRSLPQRVEALASHQIETLARKHRQVLLLADGRRDIETLARITHCSPEQLDTILDDLAAWHLIQFAPAGEGSKP